MYNEIDTQSKKINWTTLLHYLYSLHAYIFFIELTLKPNGQLFYSLTKILKLIVRVVYTLYIIYLHTSREKKC